MSGNTAGSYDTITETNAISDLFQMKSLDYKLRETDTNLAGINVVVVFILRLKFLIPHHTTIKKIHRTRYCRVCESQFTCSNVARRNRLDGYQF